VDVDVEIIPEQFDDRVMGIANFSARIFLHDATSPMRGSINRRHSMSARPPAILISMVQEF
jgi:hypothetical protein